MAAILGFEKASDFTKELKRLGINTTQPENTFTVTINGREVSASQDVEEDEDDSDEDEKRGTRKLRPKVAETV